MGRLREKLEDFSLRKTMVPKNGSQGIPMVAVILRSSQHGARVRLLATHSRNPLVVYKGFQFAILLAKILVLFLPRPLGNDFGLLFLYTIFSSHIVHCCTHGLVHHRIGIFSHTHMHSTLARTRCYMYLAYCLVMMVHTHIDLQIGLYNS